VPIPIIKTDRIFSYTSREAESKHKTTILEERKKATEKAIRRGQKEARLRKEEG